MSKFLETPFGIDLAMADIDNFLYQKVAKKIQYWRSQQLSLAGRKTIVYSVLASTLCYFTSIWVGSLKVLCRIRALLRTYLWGGSDHTSRARVRCAYYTLHRKHGDLNLLDSETTTFALLGKWIIHTLEPGDTSLKILLCYQMLTCNPTRKGGKWAPSYN